MSGPIGASSWMYGIEPAFYDYEINQSLRFNDPDNPYLYRTPSSQSSLTTFTYSFWYKRCKFGTYQEVLHVYPGSGERSQILFMNNDTLKVELEAANTNHFLTNKLFRDPSAWYHVVVAFDSTNASSTNRVKIYVNGVDEADTANGGSGFSTANYPSQNATSGFNTTTQHEISTYDGSDYHLDGYLAEVNFIDGTALTASSFGETKEGIWIPKEYSGSYGTNGFYLPFDNTSAIGEDKSPNTNNFTVVNLSAHDVVPDSPTNNFCTLNPLDNDSMTLSNGNLAGISPANAHNAVGCTVGVTGGKWYWEVRSGGTGSNYFFGMAKSTFQFISQYTNDAYNFSDIWGIATDGQKFGNGSGESSYGSSFSSGDILQLAFDLDNGKFYAGKNGTYFNSGDPAGGTNAAFTNVPTSESMQPFYGNSTSGISHTFNFGQDSSFAGTKTSGSANAADGNGIGDFYYAPPSGFLALASSNLPELDIIDGTDNFNTVLWTGNGGTSQTVTGVGFSSDFVWIKGRSNTAWHRLQNTVGGINKVLFSNDTSAEVTDEVNGHISSISSDGFDLADPDGNGGGVNGSGVTYVAWNWLAGTAFSNDASATSVGTIDSAGQVNTKAGFSIVNYTATGTAGTIAHGLSAAPELIICKHRDQSGTYWPVFYGDNTDALYLNDTAATTDDANAWNDTSPTSTVFSVGANGGDTNNSLGGATIAYCFHSVDGYSKVGTYTGNNNADGPFVYTGFRPSWILVRSIGTSHWLIFDVARHPSNVNDNRLFANLSSAEDSAYSLDLLSNGFKLRHSGSDFNTSGGTHIYLAFADQPAKFSNAR